MAVSSARRRRAIALAVLGGVTASLLIGGVAASMMYREKDAFTLYAFGPQSYATGTVEVLQPGLGQRGPVFPPRDFPPPVPSEKRDSGMGGRE